MTTYPTMTLQDAFWSRRVLHDIYTGGGEDMCDRDADVCVDLYVGHVLRGLDNSLTLAFEWQYVVETGTMIGPARPGALEIVLAVHMDAADMVAQYIAAGA